MNASRVSRVGSIIPRLFGLLVGVAAVVSLLAGCFFVGDLDAEPTYAVVYEEEFDSPASYAGLNAWLIQESQTASVWVADGAIQIFIRAEERFQMTRPLGIRTGNRFRLDVGACLVNGPVRAVLGVVFYLQDNWDHIRFAITKDGMMRLRRWTNSTWTSLTDWLPCPPINPGLDCNTITVVVDGSHFDFYVNETWVLEATDSTYSSGGIGVAAAAQAGQTGTHAAFPIVILSEPI